MLLFLRFLRFLRFPKSCDFLRFCRISYVSSNYGGNYISSGLLARGCCKSKTRSQAVSRIADLIAPLGSRDVIGHVTI